MLQRTTLDKHTPGADSAYRFTSNVRVRFLVDSNTVVEEGNSGNEIGPDDGLIVCVNMCEEDTATSETAGWNIDDWVEVEVAIGSVEVPGDDSSIGWEYGK